MKKIVLFIAEVILGVICAQLIINWTQHKPVVSPQYQSFNTNINNPDTAIIYWSHGVEFIVPISHTGPLDTIVEEDNQ